MPEALAWDPMNDSPPHHVFYAKTWYHGVSVILCTALALFGLIMGPLFLFGVLKDANGQPATDAGIALSLMSALFFCPVAALRWFNLLARRKPLLRVCSEGIEINVIGASSLDGVPLVHPMIRVVFLIVSLQGFKKQIGWLPWTMFRGVGVSGLPMMRVLGIDGTIVYPTFAGEKLSARIGDSIAFGDAELAYSLDYIAWAIQYYQSNPEARESLPSLHG